MIRKILFTFMALCLFSTGIMAQELPKENPQPIIQEKPAVTEVNSNIKADTTQIGEVKHKGKTSSKKSEGPTNEEVISSANDNKASVSQGKEKTKKQETKPEGQSDTSAPKIIEQKGEVANKTQEVKPENQSDTTTPKTAEQKGEDGQSQGKEVANKQRTAKPTTKELSDKIDSLENVVKNRQKLIEELTAKHNADSLTIIETQQKLDKVVNDQKFLDTCMVKLANRWLRERFSKEGIADAISVFNKIYASELKRDLSIVQELLMEYEPAYREFQTILKAAQDDFRRTKSFTTGTAEAYKADFSNKLKRMAYCQKYHNDEQGWRIEFLDGEIKKALDILKAHKANSSTTNFESLIDPNFK